MPDGSGTRLARNGGNTGPESLMSIHIRLSAALLALATTLAGASGVTSAGGFQPVDSIRAAALSALADGASAEVTLDPALRMPRCSQALQARRSGSGTVEVGCPSGWRLYVPVRVSRSQQVLVLVRGVSAGEMISQDMFVPERRDASRIAGAALSEPASAVGRAARRTLMAGSVLTGADLVAARLVRRGDTISLVSRQDGVEVRMVGRALADAGERERVSAENLSSRKVVQGVVNGDGEVVVSR